MLHAGLDLSRKRVDYCLLAEGGERVEVGEAPPDADGLVAFARGFRSVMVVAGARGDRVDERCAVRA